MTDFPHHQHLYHDQLHKRQPRRLAKLAALIGCTALLAAGCGGKSGSANGASSANGTSRTPQQVVAAAAVRSAQISSAHATITQVAHGAAGQTISGSVQEQLRPTLLVGMKMKLASGAANETLSGIVTGKAIYLKISALAQQTGKAWLKVPFSSLGSGKSSLALLFKSLSKINPAQQSALFAGAKNVRDRGTQVINGVRTTQYSGSIVPAAGLAALPPALRKRLAPLLKTITGRPRFNVWIDAQGHIRKQVLDEIASGVAITTTTTFSAINQPVHVALPPASQVVTVPKSVLGAAST